MDGESLEKHLTRAVVDMYVLRKGQNDLILGVININVLDPKMVGAT